MARRRKTSMWSSNIMPALLRLHRRGVKINAIATMAVLSSALV
jgi:hypothetical protein